MRWLVLVAMVGVMALAPGCILDNDDDKDGGSTATSAVVFVQWSSYGSSGAVGTVKNTSSSTVKYVQVKTSLCGRTMTSDTSPRNLKSGERGSFSGVGSSACGDGVIEAPEIDWIHYE